MRIGAWKLWLAICLSIAGSVLTIHAQEDVYLINRGQLMRWGLDMKTRKRLPMPLRVPMPAELATIASFAVNRRNEAVCRYRTRRSHLSDRREAAKRVYQHSEPIAQIAFGRSNDLLYFSIAKPTPTRRRFVTPVAAAFPLRSDRRRSLHVESAGFADRAARDDFACGRRRHLDGNVHGRSRRSRVPRHSGGPCLRASRRHSGLRYENAADNILGMSFERMSCCMRPAVRRCLS